LSGCWKLRVLPTASTSPVGRSEERRRTLSWCRNWVRETERRTEKPELGFGLAGTGHPATKTGLPRGLDYLLRSARQCSTQSRKLSFLFFQDTGLPTPVTSLPLTQFPPPSQLPTHRGRASLDPVFLRGGIASWHPRVWTVAYCVLDALFWWMKAERAVWECG